MEALIAIIALALVFDYINGFHDAANSIATIVSTRVLSPRVAVAWAAFFNFIAFFFFESHVAGNIAKGVHANVVTLTLVGAGLFGAILWDLLTWWLSLPTSSSHALLGGMAGAAIVKGGFGALDPKLYIQAGIFIFVSPFMGMVLGAILMRLVIVVFGSQSPSSVDKSFRRLQLLSASLYSIGHGGNDAQKTAGIIAAALIATGHLESAPGVAPHVPIWVVLSCFVAMGLGTLSGGMRIVQTMGMRITKLAPVGGFCAETSGAITLFIATAMGVPVSTTHTITGAIVGAGSQRGWHAVRWGVAGRIVWAWVLTVPGAAAISAITYLVATALGVSP
jgi:inorganic phosphate transporter, PiT family